jgi:hypothetical protein
MMSIYQIFFNIGVKKLLVIKLLSNIFNNLFQLILLRYKQIPIRKPSKKYVPWDYETEYPIKIRFIHIIER